MHQLDLWIAHTAGRHMDEIYRSPSTELGDEEGALVLIIDWGTKRSWE